MRSLLSMRVLAESRALGRETGEPAYCCSDPIGSEREASDGAHRSQEVLARTDTTRGLLARTLDLSPHVARPTATTGPREAPIVNQSCEKSEGVCSFDP